MPRFVIKVSNGGVVRYTYTLAYARYLRPRLEKQWGMSLYISPIAR